MLISLKSTSRSRGLTLAAVFLMAGILIASATAIWMLRLGIIADTQDDNHRLAAVLADQTARTFQAADLVLKEMADKIRISDVHDLESLHAKFGGQDIHDALAKRLVDLPQATAFTMLDSAGHFVNDSTQWPMPKYSDLDRSYFQHFLAGPDPEPYVSEPMITRSTHASAVLLVRQVNASNGRFLGVVMTPLRLDYFTSVLTGIGLSDGSTVTIARHDGLVLVYVPKRRIAPGQYLPAKLPWYRTVAAGGGEYASTGAFAEDGKTFTSVRPLQTYPIVIDVGRTQDAALARWWWQTVIKAAVMLTATLGLALLLRALTRQIAISATSQEEIQRQIVAVRASESRLANTLEHMNQGLIMVDAAGRVAICNRRATEILDVPTELMAVQACAADAIEHRTQWRSRFAPDTLPVDVDIPFLRPQCYERRQPDGTLVEIRTAPLPDGSMVRTYTDITARAASEAMFAFAASHDQLTGLANRNGFDSTLDRTFIDARHDGTHLAVLCLDFDRFKAVNDTFGHDAGDRLLIEAAKRMQEVVRVTDIICRLGGDKFAVILPDSTLASAEVVAHRLLEGIGAPYTLSEKTLKIGVSIGIATYPIDGSSAEQLLCNADTALYKAKAAGRNICCTYTAEDGLRQQRRQEFERDFRAAVELKQFTLAYQPICDSITSEPVAFEALLRWNHPMLGAVSPQEFIPLAEQTDLIRPLGRWVIETACAEACTWDVPLRIAVNLSPAQFRDDDLLSFIRDVLVRTGLPPSRLDLEVTEGLLLEDAPCVREVMRAIRAMGIRMVLDDFGISHSNLSYLQDFTFDVLKIDRSFLRTLGSDPQARTLVEAMISMAHALSLDVVGEGVETEEQLNLLRPMQCRWVQGFLLGRPSASKKTRELIRALAIGRTPIDHLAAADAA